MKRIYRALGTIALGSLIGSCGDGPTEPPTPTTATVVMSVGTASLVPAASIQLSAIAKAQSGQALPRVFTWMSSDPAKATVSSSGMVVGVMPGTATVTAGVDGKSASTTVTVLDGGVVSSTGATLQVGSGLVQITVPPGAVSSATSVSVVPSTAFANEPRVVKGTPFEFGPAGTTFAKPVGLTLKYDQAVLPMVTEERALRIYLLEGSAWRLVEGSTVDLLAKTVTAQVSHFSTYAILTPVPVSSVTVTVSPATVFVGQTSQAAAVLRDLGGNVLDGRAVSWISSDTGVATVDATSGLVTAIAPGTAAITATSETQNGAATVTVTPTPVASVSVSVATSGLVVGQTTQATATPRDGNGAALSGRMITWSSGSPATATVSSDGLITAVVPGTAEITATSEGTSGVATVTVTAIPVASVSVNPSTSSVVAGATQQLSAETRDASNNILSGRSVNWSSSDPAVASISATGLVTAVAPGIATITATSEGESGTSSITVIAVPVGSVTVTLAASSINAIETTQATATILDGSGGVLTGRAITWSSDNAGVATVSGTGLVTAVSEGTATITATSEGRSGSATIAVGPVPVATVTVSPANATLVAGSTQQLSAETRDASNDVLTGRTVTWSSSAPDVATVSGSGVVTAVAPGAATITATSEGQSSTSFITVTPAPVASVSVTLAANSINTGETTQATATTRDANDNVLAGRTLTWSSDNTGVATVSAAGVVTAFGVGTANISATSEGKSGSATLTVTPAPVASVSVSLALASIQANQTTQATATTLDVNSNVLTDRSITWSSDNASVATISPTGLVTAVAPGTASITATSEGKTGSAPLTVIPVPVATVTISPAAASVVAGSTQQLSAEAKDVDNNVLTGRFVSWGSSNEEVATVSTSGTVTAVVPGTATITATSEGQSGASSITVTPVPVASVTVTLGSSAISAIETTQATATTLDGRGGVLTGRAVIWTSDNTAVATVSSTGLVTAVSAGTVNITATSEGQTGSAGLTVTLAPVATVTVSPGAASIVSGSTQQLSSETRDAHHNVLTGRSVSWSSSDESVATVSASGLVTAVVPGSATITATSEGQSGTSSITVTPAPVASVTVALAVTSINAVETTQATATTYDGSGAVLTGRTVTWSTDNEAVATVSSTGFVTAISAGTVNIIATSETQSGSAPLTVTIAPVAIVTVNPATASVVAGSTQQFSAETRDAGSNVLTGRLVSWASSDEGVATVSATGLVTAVAPGTATITATSEGQSGASSITVTPVPVASVSVALALSSITAIETTQATATALDGSGGLLTGRDIAWTSGNTAVATVSATGLVRAVGVGTASIIATSEGKIGSATLSVTPAPVASITVALAASSIIAGETTQGTATTRDANGGLLTDRIVTWSSDNEAVANVSSSGLVTGLAPGPAAITATSEGQSGTASVTVTPVPVASVSVAVVPSSISAVETAQATATTLDASGGVLTGRTIAWSSDNTSVATVSATTGLVTAIGTGTTQITAASEGKIGSATITVTPAPVATVTVTLAASSINAVQATQATATLHDSKGRVLSGRSITWSSDNTGVATVSTDGLVTAVSEGTANVTATSEEQSGGVLITVTPAPVNTVTLNPATLSIVAGNTEQLTASLKDAQNRELTDRTVTWLSDNTGVATVSSTGVVTGVSVGTATITASSEGQTGTATITVTPVPVATVTVTLFPSSVTAVETSQATAVTLDAAGGTLTGRPITWSSDNTSVASVSSTGLVTAIAAGTANITAASEGKSGSATLTVTPAPVAIVTVSPPNASVVAGATHQFLAETRDARNSILEGRDVSWQSDHPEIATVSTSGLVTAVIPGSATISATSEGKTGTATVTVNPVPVASVSVQLSATSIVAGETATASATTRDLDGNILTGRSVTWSSDNLAAAAVSSSGLITANGPGLALITAESEGQTGSETLTVTPIPVASVTVSPATASLVAGSTQQFSAETKDAGDNVLTGRTVSWSSSDMGVATVSATGLVTTVAPGLATITATSEGKTGAATITVTPAPVASVSVSLALASIQVAQTTQATATTLDSNSNVLTGRSIVWTSDTQPVATVSSLGVVTAVAPGTATITATSEGESGSATITVVPIPVASVSVALVPSTITAVETAQASATTRDADGGELTGRAITWNSDNTGVATVSSTGVVTAVSVGTTQISATSEGKAGSATVTVTPAPVASVTVGLASTTITAIGATQATATLHDANGETLTGRPITWTSDNPSVATVSSTGFVTAVSPGAANITATSEGETGSAQLTVTPAPVATVTVSPVTASIVAGSTEQLSAETRDANNNVLAGRSVSWSSSDEAVATVSNAGLVTGVAPGSATITATSEGISATSSVTVMPVPVASVTVTLASSSINSVETTQAAATTFDASGGIVTGRAVAWSSDNVAVATVNSTGLVTAVSAGTANIVATSEGRNGNAQLTVTPAPVASVTVSPASATVIAGSTEQLSATPRDAQTNVLSDRAIIWSSSAPAIATVSETGLVTAVAPGSATITATSEGQTGFSSITVTPVPVASVTVALAASSITAVETSQATATTFDGSGVVLTDRAISWSSDNTAVATVSSSGLVTAVSAGTANIIAASEGKSGSATLTVTPAPVASVSVTLAAASITALGTTQATATLKDAQDRMLTGRSVVWSSDNTGVATVSSSGLVSAVSAGTANIIATSEGQSNTALLTVTPAPVASVTVSPAAATAIAGSTQQLTAETRDAASNILTGRSVNWSSSDQNVATVSTSGLVTAVTPGTATITATSEGQSGTSSITVTPVPVGSVSVTLASSSIIALETTQATATTFDGSGGVLTGRSITWSSDNNSVATVSSAGLVTAVSTGTANIIATSEGKSGSAPLTVTPAPVAAVTVSPASATVIAGSTEQLTATLRDAHNNVLTDRVVTWTSSAPSIATVSASGLVTAVAEGSATITGTSEGRSGTSSITVTPVPVASVTVALAATSVNAVETTQATATTLDGSGGVLTGRAVIWSSENTAVATVSANGLVTAVSAGTATITATSEGQSGSATLTVTQAPVASVSVTLAATSITAVETTQATATLKDAQDRVLTGRTVVWSSDNTAVATVSPFGLLTAVGAGTANIIATSEGQNGGAALIVTPAPVVTVTVNPSTVSVVTGSTQQLSAEMKDAHDNVLTGRLVGWSSSNESVATVSASGLLTAVAVGSVTITATSEGQSGASSVTVTAVPVATVTVVLASTSITAIETTQATATTLDVGGGVLTGRDVTWSSDNTGVATVASDGFVTAVSVGTVNITATSEGKSGSATLVITPVPVATVSVSLALTSIQANQTTQATATTLDVNSNVLTDRSIVWSSDNASVATISPTGLVTAVAPGTASITATSEGKTGSAPLTVIPVPVATVTISPAAASVVAGSTQQLSAEAKDVDNNVLTGRFVTWGSSNEEVATVSTSGTVTAVVPGTATITATSEGQSGTSTITVTPVPVASVSVALESASITAIESTQATATTFDAEGGVLTSRQVTWSSDNTAVATVSITGLVTAVGVGTANITATSEAKSGSATLTVTPAPVATVTVSPAAASVVAGSTQQLSAETRDPHNNVLTGRLVTWSSSDESVATVNAVGLVTGGAPGIATVTATSEGQSGSSSITVTPVPVASVSVALVPSSITAVETAQATATTLDASGGVLTGRTITWSSDNEAVATVSATGLVTAVAVGTANIIAASEGESGSSTLTVTQAPVATVSIALAASSINAVQTTQATATLKDAKDRVLTGRPITWSSDNEAVATVSSTGLVTAIAVGTANISATSEAQSGSTTLAVTPAPVGTVTVSPAAPGIVAGNTEQLTATLRDSQNRVLTDRTMTWTSDQTAVATVSSTGLVTGVSAGTATITAISEGVNGTSLVTVTAPLSTVSLLHRSTQNTRYFENESGQIVYLTGSHTWSNLQDNGTTDPPAAFNYTAYLDFLTEHNHNFFRLWAWEQAKWTAEISADYWITPGPFARTGPSNALDGKPRFDLTQFNQAYFDRLRQRVIDAGARGIYVSVMLFDGWSVGEKGGFGQNNPWKGHPFNAANNINGINGDTNGDEFGFESHTLGNSAVTALQEAYVRRVIDAVGDLDNVLYEISNESDASSRDWQYHMIQVIRDYESTRPKQHPVGMTAMWPGGSDADLTGSTADWISASGSVAGSVSSPATATGSKVLITDTDHLCGICGDMAWVWKSFTKGHNPILMDGYDDAAIGMGAAGYDPTEARWEEIRKSMGYTRSYAQRMDLAAAVPHGDLVLSEGTGYALVKPGSQYLVFVPGGGSVTLNLSAVTGSLNVEWFNPSTGVATQAGTVDGGPSRALTAPFGGAAVLFLH